jgi:hypothetical protein
LPQSKTLCLLSLDFVFCFFYLRLPGVTKYQLAGTGIIQNEKNKKIIFRLYFKGGD